jgi:hypothetical protein
MPEPVFIKLGTYIMASWPNSTAYLINPFHKPLCLYVYHSTVARQWLGKNVTAVTNTRSNGTTVERVVFYAVRVVSMESSRLVLPRTSSFIYGSFNDTV